MILYNIFWLHNYITAMLRVVTTAVIDAQAYAQNSFSLLYLFIFLSEIWFYWHASLFTTTLLWRGRIFGSVEHFDAFNDKYQQTGGRKQGDFQVNEQSGRWWIVLLLCVLRMVSSFSFSSTLNMSSFFTTVQSSKCRLAILIHVIFYYNNWISVHLNPQINVWHLVCFFC